MKRFFRLVWSNFWWKVAALAIAVLLWVVVSSESEISIFRAVPVEFKDLPEDLEISSSVVDSVYLELRGPSGELRDSGDSHRIAVVLDMARVHPGVQTFTIGGGNVVLPRGLRLVRSVPAQLRFEFELIRSRSVPVQPHFSKGPQKGYEIAEYTVTPPMLVISGPESRIQRVRAAMTDPIDLSAVVGTAEFRVHASVDDARARFQTNPEVVVRVNVRRNEPEAETPASR
ncbi:MAG TPA: CdaR family protein [Bryobacteraceae bacterium]|nr:CdaR family protein [Bryobacteraceae bacterium]